MLQGTFIFSTFADNLHDFPVHFPHFELQGACGGGCVQGGESEALLRPGDSHRCESKASVVILKTLQGLHLPNLVEKVCQKGSRLRHLHLEELNQPPDNTSLLEEDPIVSIFF